MARRVTRPRELQFQVFRGSAAIRQGLLTSVALRSESWVRVRHDVYADSRLERDHELACRAATLRVPADAVIAGPSAAVLWGIPHAARVDDPVHLLVPPGSPLGARNGLRVHEAQVEERDVVARADLRRTTPTRTAWDVAAWLEVTRAVAIIDSMLANRLVSVASLTRMVDRERGSRYSVRAAAAFGLADAGAQSPPESHLRVGLVLAGLPRPVTQHPIQLPDGTVVHPDPAWPEYQVAVEYDGHWHADPDQLHRDRSRLNRLVAAGWLVLHVTSRRPYRDLARVVREVREALRSRGWGSATSAR